MPIIRHNGPMLSFFCTIPAFISVQSPFSSIRKLVFGISNNAIRFIIRFFLMLAHVYSTRSEHWWWVCLFTIASLLLLLRNKTHCSFSSGLCSYSLGFSEHIFGDSGCERRCATAGGLAPVTAPQALVSGSIGDLRCGGLAGGIASVCS